MLTQLFVFEGSLAMEGGEARDPSRGLPTKRVGESAVRGIGVASFRVILSSEPPKVRFAHFRGTPRRYEESRKRGYEGVIENPRRSRPTVDPADFDYANTCRYPLRSG